MKKTFVSMMVIAMVLCFSVMAFAAPVATTVNIKGGTVSVDVVDDFSSYSSSDDFANTGYWSYAYAGGKLTLKLDGTSPTFYHIGTSSAVTPSLADTESNALHAEATYFGFKIKNSASEEFAIAPEFITDDGGEWNTLLQGHNTEEEIAADPIYLLSKKSGKVAAKEVAQANDHGNAAVIPANFDGWVFFPMARINDSTKLFKSFQFTGNNAEGTEYTIVIDNFAYAKNLTVTEGETETADVSVILYAVAAITGCGALAIRKKK